MTPEERSADALEAIQRTLEGIERQLERIADRDDDDYVPTPRLPPRNRLAGVPNR